ncbi:MAG: ABC transporter permease, partial [Acidobacteria bacterium]|nr:ABC transporter permease [Acidobacteriota bacterium]
MTLLRLSLRNVRRRFVVFIFTALAVILGVAFVVGTFVITDALRETFDNLAVDIGGTIDYQVRAAPLLGEQEDAPPIDPDLVDVIAGVDGVAAVEGSVREFNVNPLD